MTRYELLDRIGVGGMAEIFRGRAIAAGGFEKPVAIKRILPHLSQDKRFVELLIAEAKVLSLLKHRNIVQIFDVGLGDDGKYFLVMEYVDGKDVGAIQRGLELSRRRIPFDLALHVGAEICEALEHAHMARAPDGKAMSLVHRDVSPSNVLVSRAGEVKLTDFGIAKRAEQETTGHGAVRGKFAYISPEQARNDHLDPRSDVFSVGILLWELVTGRRLFSGLGDLEALRAVREAQVPRPREFDTRLGADIDGLIMSTLSPEPRGRPTAGQLGARLRSLRYSLDVTVGDPASELAKIIDAADTALRESAPAPQVAASVELGDAEATVIRIHTADEFSMQEGGMARARQVIDRFDEDETRQAQLSRDQIAFLRETARDSGEMTSAVEPPLPGVHRASAEQTRAREPIEDAPTFPPPDAPTFLPDSGPNPTFDGDEATRLVAPTNRRSAPPELLHDLLADQTPEPPRSRRLAEEALHREDEPPSRPQRRHEALSSRRHEELSSRRHDDESPSRSQRRHEEPLSRRYGEEPSHHAAEPPRRPGTQPPPMPPGSYRAPTGESHTPPPGTVQERRPGLPPTPPPASGHPPPPALPPTPLPPPVPLPPAPRPMAMPPMAMPPMAMPPMAMPPPAQVVMPPPASYSAWMTPNAPARPMPQARPGTQRGADSRASVTSLGRKKPLKPWVLMVGALFMALLAFAVTRACIHTATRPAPAAKP